MSEQSSCPVAGHGATVQTAGRGADLRKSKYAHETEGPGVERDGEVWRIRSVAAAREVLRSRETTQAGFNCEYLVGTGIRLPILFQDGPDHRAQRAAIARYFAPKTVASRYEGLMVERAEALLDQAREQGRFDLSELAMHYSVQVAAEVVGLTNSDMEKMATRLVKFFSLPMVPPAGSGGVTMRSRFNTISNTLRGQLPMWHFHLTDVRPAIKARRENPREDVISHCLAEGFNDREVLVECMTYAAAGMVTTREFISMTTWHLLEQPELRERYLAAEQPERLQILHEILRLEPVVGHLYRRTTADLIVPGDDGEVTIPAGAVVDLQVRQTNTEPATVGEDGLDLCPGRTLPPRVGDEVMSFGDGAHKCPGNSLAIHEADVLLTRLLALPLRLATTPTIGWDELIKGYEVRNIELELVEA